MRRASKILFNEPPRKAKFIGETEKKNTDALTKLKDTANELNNIVQNDFAEHILKDYEHFEAIEEAVQTIINNIKDLENICNHLDEKDELDN